MSSYLKLGGDWPVRHSIQAPFITKSAQTFFLDNIPIETLNANLIETDVFRFAIQGQIGYATHSAAIEYDVDHILVIPNRDILVAYQGFHNANLASPEVINMFHYCPDNALTLRNFIINN